MTTLKNIFENKIIAIIRGINPKDVLNIANTLYEGGIKVIEITLNSPDALSVIRKLSQTIGDRMIIGAGTVLDASSAKSAIEAGAKFIISPGLNIETIQVTKQFGAVSIPGAFTPTEVILAYNAGGDIIKLFPALNVEYFKNIRSPLNHIPIMPTGGITLNNIKAFKKEGAVAFGIGSSLVNALNPVNTEYINELKEKAKNFVQSLESD
ncbi:MAG: bifunctional 4-hydroxy-2-oxoglutarate aldolase/2-dehydro-3-deoxy-phosphogluconate aldolase [Bacteroidota bacterium]|nr:bifunctional 4-hydroxy-2-oxoglutarate aldolase/2-dehydro-3-deoxy-phosphogluconate aldolase [Bacteroidota bacterium]